MAFKAKESNEKDREKFFALDPMGKLFVYHFTGKDFTKHVELHFSVSLLLAIYSQVIVNGINEILEGKLYLLHFEIGVKHSYLLLEIEI